MRKLLLCLAIAMVSLNITPAFAEKTIISITPVKKITTAKDVISEGDYVDFKVLDSDTVIRGLVVKYEQNSWLGKEAILVIDQFRSLDDTDEKFSGTLSLSGNQHNQAGEFLTWFDLWIRGGEVTILPDKDVFSLWRE